MKGNSFTVGIDYKNWGGHAWQDSINDNQNELVNKTVNEVAGYVIMQQDLFDKVSLTPGFVMSITVSSAASGFRRPASRYVRSRGT